MSRILDEKMLLVKGKCLTEDGFNHTWSQSQKVLVQLLLLLLLLSMLHSLESFQ
jgi:hypothetical protein